MRCLVLLCLLGLTLVACGPSAEVPTPLPTAVPPDSKPDGTWAISLQHEFPVGTFGDGVHRYRYLLHCPVFSGEDFNTDWLYFEISDGAQVQPAPVYLRLQGVSTDPLASSYSATTSLHPEQPIIAVVHYVGLARPAAELAASDCEAIIFWDNVGRQALTTGEPFQP